MAGSGEKWRWADSEGVQRVVPIEELRTALASGVLPPTTLVWRAGMPKWQRASEVPELTAAPSPSLRGTIVGIPPPPASMVAVQAAYETGNPKSEAGGASGGPATAPAGGGALAPTPSPAPVIGNEAKKGASTASDGKKPGIVVGAAAPTEPKKKSVPPGDAKKKSVPPGDTAAAEPKKQSATPNAPLGAVKKKSVPPPAPPAPSIKPVAPASVADNKADTGKASQVPPNAWGAPATKPSARAPGASHVTVDKSAPTPAADARAVADANRNVAISAPASGSAQSPPAPAHPYAAAPNRDESELETWVAKPAQSAQELAFAAQRAGGGAAPSVKPAPSGTPPPPPAHAPGPKSTFPLGGLPPTRMTSPLPPPPRRSHPAPGGSPTPSTAPLAFSQSTAAQPSPFTGRDGLAPPPSMPPLQPPASYGPSVASPNGIAEGDLPAFPLDEIDPDDERPFRPSQGAPAMSPSGHPALDATGEPASDGTLRGVLAYIRANPKDPKLLAALSGGAVLVVGLLWGVAAMSGASSKNDASDDALKAPQVGADPAASAHAAPSAAAAAQAGQAAAVKPTACRVTGTPARLSDKASKDVPLELLVTSSGEKARLGFATSTNSALGVSVDLSSLQVTVDFTKPPRDRLRAVIPFGETGPEFVAQLEGHADKLKAWRTISVDPPTVIGWSGTALAIASKAKEVPTPLWTLEGADPIDVIRAAHTNDRAHAIVFRRHGAIYGGMIGADRAPIGELTKIAGAGAPPGSPVGTPTIAVNGQSVAVAFADRASTDEPWSIRVGTAPLGSFPTTTTLFTVPPGGPGGATLAPALSGLPDGRWLLVWTEGSGGAHDVRGMTLGADLASVGTALTISREGSNAGQGAVALRAGRGLVAYLSLTEEGYEVWGTSTDCR